MVNLSSKEEENGRKREEKEVPPPLPPSRMPNGGLWVINTSTPS